ncbi:hypothetical protein BJF92_00715 [Rhizobium rhizosphaerae]|uniref:Uncharacterized protein n=1 Tax=Xaviernesmea rhizosphaerae TaxID=1672749 RepID=A0A1Q9AEH5_9HYPH|nr:hypothetical protein [Xaviernesmea rhizosphaerae]OLP53323.1 hypothetical protein BJF92_00715 [Xaviernesmea rhizosphaerae]
MQSDLDYTRLIERMTPAMHDCVRGFLLKYTGDPAPHEEDIEQWVRDDLDNHVDELTFEERELVEARLLRTIRMRLNHGGLRGVH